MSLEAAAEDESFWAAAEGAKVRVFRALQAVFPAAHFTPNSVICERLTDGATNVLFKCSFEDAAAKTQPKLPPTCLVRFYGRQTERLIDREAEIAIFRFLSAERFFPAFYGAFKGGVVYAFVPGVALTTRSVRQAPIAAAIAAHVAAWHCALHAECVVPRDDAFVQRFVRRCRASLQAFGERWTAPANQAAYDAMQRADVVPSAAAIDAFLAEAVEAARERRFPVVFCHNDLLPGNIVLTPDDRVTFIDFEYAAYNFRGFDICNHWVEYAGMTADTCYDDSFPDETLQRDWIAAYLRAADGLAAAAAATGKNGGLFPETAPFEARVEALRVETLHFRPLVHLFWGLWALVQAEHSPIDFGYMKWAEKRLLQFRKHSRNVL